MVGFLFWNLHRKRLEVPLQRLAIRHKLDVLILAECAIPEAALLKALNAGGQGTYRRKLGRVSERLALYSRLEPACFGGVLEESDHYVIRTLTPPKQVEIVLALAHLRSPRYSDREARHSHCIGFAQAIKDAERKAGTEHTVVVGDLNVNPYDSALLDARALSALADRKTVLHKNPRRLGKLRVEAFRPFYNPMWSHFGDAVAPAGTYYYDKSNDPVDPYWNMFDQVLLRPDLLDRFDSKNLQILTTDGMHSFVRKDGRPDSDLFSDHLPLWFQLDLRRR